MSLSTDKPTYTPGQPAKLTFAVKDEQGKPAVAALGVQIVDQAVFSLVDAQPGLSFSALQAAANTALLTDPATLMRYIQSPNAVSGVGDAGLSNYANEPLRTPKQPVVSQ